VKCSLYHALKEKKSRMSVRQHNKLQKMGFSPIEVVMIVG